MPAPPSPPSREPAVERDRREIERGVFERREHTVSDEERPGDLDAAAERLRARGWTGAGQADETEGHPS